MTSIIKNHVAKDSSVKSSASDEIPSEFYKSRTFIFWLILPFAVLIACGLVLIVCDFQKDVQPSRDEGVDAMDKIVDDLADFQSSEEEEEQEEDERSLVGRLKIPREYDDNDSEEKKKSRVFKINVEDYEDDYYYDDQNYEKKFWKESVLSKRRGNTYTWNEIKRRTGRRRRDAEEAGPSPRVRPRVASLKSRYVNCARFRAEARGKYLASASLRALDMCYRHGVFEYELNRGIGRNEKGVFRYDLDNLYVACEDVFDESIDELTDQLRSDFERCKWAGALTEEQQRFIQDRFHEKLAPPREVSDVQQDQQDVPSNLEQSRDVAAAAATTSSSSSSTTTEASAATGLDPRAFIDCSHVETELFEDYFESPSYEALQHCQKYGVTSEELRRGISRNPRPEKPRYDVSDLYLPCMDFFAGSIDYITNELRDDYHRCKRVGAITRRVQLSVERKFHDSLNKVRRKSQ